MLSIQQNSQRQVYELSGFYRFCPDWNRLADEENWENGLRGRPLELAVPGSWNEQRRDLYEFHGEGWYEREFEVPHGWLGQRIWLRIGSTAGNARIWVDGKLLGQHRGPHLPFEFEVTDHLRVPGRHRLTIAVDNTLRHYDLPPGQARSEEQRALGQSNGKPDVAYDFFPFGGIHRPVTFYTTGAAKLDRLRIETGFQGNEGWADVFPEVEGDAWSEISVEMAGVTSRLGQANREDGLRVSIPDVRLWSPADPFLYEVIVRLWAEDGSVLDEYTQRIGVRTVRVDGDQLLLNDEPIFLRGVGKHEDFPLIGKGWMPACVVRDFDLMKWMGMNSFRTTHYPYAEEMLDYADRQGMLVIGEAPFVGLKEHLYTQEMLDRACSTIGEMIRRDCNHPSVILWSLANEPNVRCENGRKFFKGMAEAAREADSSRPVMFVAHQLPDNNLGGEFYDLIGINKYHGWYSDAGEIDGSLHRLVSDLEAFHDAFGCPIMLTEFGADAVAGMHSDPPGMFSEEYQAETIVKQYKAVKDIPWLAGAHVWGFADFKMQQSYTRVQGNRKGLFTRDRQPKMAAHALRALWASDGGNLNQR